MLHTTFFHGCLTRKTLSITKLYLDVPDISNYGSSIAYFILGAYYQRNVPKIAYKNDRRLLRIIITEIK